MTVFPQRGRVGYEQRLVHENDRIVRYDKRERVSEMLHIDYGLGVFSAEVLASRPDDLQASSISPKSQRELVAKDALAGHEVFRRFYEMGSHAGLSELEALLLQGTPP